MAIFLVFMRDWGRERGRERLRKEDGEMPFVRQAFYIPVVRLRPSSF
jgi:hypothetical protein